VLDRAHNKRNVAEYEGELDFDPALLATPQSHAVQFIGRWKWEGGSCLCDERSIADECSATWMVIANAEMNSKF
jgi:hypothetical protein